MKRAGGSFLLLLWSVLAFQKAQAGVAPELFWLCHVTSAMLAVGLLLSAQLLISTALLCQLAIAVPAYALHLATNGETSAVSFLLHVLAPLLGVLAWRGKAIPLAAPWCGGVLYLGLMAASYWATPENLNVNLAFRPWGPVAWAGVWPARLLNLTLVLGLLHAARLLWNRRAN
jgi:hypothetical protein